MTDVILWWLALMLWSMRHWDEISYDERAVKVQEKIHRTFFRTQKFDQKIENWLREDPRK